MKVISVNVGVPSLMTVGDRSVLTGIRKAPVAGRVRVGTLNLEGDGQADLSVHGGADKAVYVFPSEHYEFWQGKLHKDLPWGAFGENLTAAGLFEGETGIGDQFEIGTAVFEISQPRLPCFKLAGKFQRDQIIKEFLDSRGTGFYMRVLQEGDLQAGDPILLRAREPRRLTVREIVDLYLVKQPSRAQLEQTVSTPALSESWRSHFQSIL
jgi:MOSC domain-containing protein YiiM